MAELLEIITQLDDTEAAIARTEQEMARHPGEHSLRLVLASLEKRQENLSIQFTEAASARGINVCTYRLFDKLSERPNLRTFANTLRAFQELVTMVYDALRNGPKERIRAGVESVAKTSFGLAYTFSGSLGAVLTLPNEGSLFPAFDDAVTTVFRLAQAGQPSEVASFVKSLGAAAVRSAYQWAAHHAEAGVGADIQWRSADDVRASILLQPQELSRLHSVIGETSDVSLGDPFTWSGLLLGGDVATRTFHMSFEGADDIRGRMAKEFKTDNPLILNEPYLATIRKQTITKLATEKIDDTYELLDIKPLISSQESE